MQIARRYAFFILAAGCLVLAYGALKNLWGYQDSPSLLYIALGAFWTAAATGFLALAIRMLRQSK